MVVLYAIAGWVVIEVASTVLPGLNLPEWAPTLVIVLVALGFPLAVGLAWAFDIGPEGVTRTGPDEALPPAAETAPAAEAPPEAIPAASTPAKLAVDDHSIAVLPFVNMSGDPENEYFSDGLTEELLNALVRVGELKVTGRTSSFAFKGQNQDLREIGRQLNVANVLEGSVRKAGNRFAITPSI